MGMAASVDASNIRGVSDLISAHMTQSTTMDVNLANHITEGQFPIWYWFFFKIQIGKMNFLLMWSHLLETFQQKSPKKKNDFLKRRPQKLKLQPQKEFHMKSQSDKCQFIKTFRESGEGAESEDALGADLTGEFLFWIPSPWSCPHYLTLGNIVDPAEFASAGRGARSEVVESVRIRFPLVSTRTCFFCCIVLCRWRVLRRSPYCENHLPGLWRARFVWSWHGWILCTRNFCPNQTNSLFQLTTLLLVGWNHVCCSHL